ncbi:Sigma-70 region 2 [Clostridiales bacterium oral taxon 876 str. F0540]|nr:Sigma-70 region 2 [Clostridiales bacterium oral taxon 876 str. F0540]
MIGLDEFQLLEGLRNKDEQCFLEIVNRFKRKVISLCYTYTRDYNEAEDLSQEVFLSLYNSIGNFRGDCSISTYIYRISLSKCMDYKRKRSIKNFLSGLLNVHPYKEENLDDKNYIRQCIVNLPEDMKKVVILYYYAGLTQKEIGSLLNISEKAVEGRIYRAKQKLKIEFEKEGYALCRKNETV